MKNDELTPEDLQQLSKFEAAGLLRKAVPLDVQERLAAQGYIEQRTLLSPYSLTEVGRARLKRNRQTLL